MKGVEMKMYVFAVIYVIGRHSPQQVTITATLVVLIANIDQFFFVSFSPKANLSKPDITWYSIDRIYPRRIIPPGQICWCCDNESKEDPTDTWQLLYLKNLLFGLVPVELHVRRTIIILLDRWVASSLTNYPRSTLDRPSSSLPPLLKKNKTTT